MNNSRALFEVGEEVILCSKRQPQYNGEYVVLACEWGYYIDINTNKYRKGFTYDLGIHGDAGNSHWSESNLRKKHPPSELNFTDLMSSLTDPIEEKA